MTRENAVFEIIKANPGATGYQIWVELIKQSRSAKWFGKDSILTQLFGASSGGLYVTLTRLESAGRVTSHWGMPTPARGGRRPRHYYVTGHEQT